VNYIDINGVSDEADRLSKRLRGMAFPAGTTFVVKGTQGQAARVCTAHGAVDVVADQHAPPRVARVAWRCQSCQTLHDDVDMQLASGGKCQLCSAKSIEATLRSLEPSVYSSPLADGWEDAARKYFAKVTSDKAQRVHCTFPVYNAKFYIEPTDPLEVEYDGVALRELLMRDEMLQLEFEGPTAIVARHRAEPNRYRPLLTPAQRAAVSAHWSAELRRKVEAGKERDKAKAVSVCVEVDE
jgi:hypothetical protein